jgi:hypothetical protein
MSAAGVNFAPAGPTAAAGSSDTAAAAAAAAAAGGAGGVFGGNQSQVEEMILLVREDVERMGQQWRQTEGCKIEAVAGDVWEQ